MLGSCLFFIYGFKSYKFKKWHTSFVGYASLSVFARCQVKYPCGLLRLCPVLDCSISILSNLSLHLALQFAPSLAYTHRFNHSCVCIGLLREQDSNLRPVDYESTELPTAPPRDVTYIRVCEPAYFLCFLELFA